MHFAALPRAGRRRRSLTAFERVKSFFDTLSNETYIVGLSFEKAAARRADPEKPSLFGATAFALRKIDIDLLSWYNFQE